MLRSEERTARYLIPKLKAAGAHYVREPLVVDKNLILAEGPPESSKFGQAILTALASA